MPVIIKCKECGKEFKAKPSQASQRVYCSKECMSIGYQKKRLKKVCINCGKEFEVYDNIYRRDAKFCNKKCMGEYMSGEHHWNYKHGEKWEVKKKKAYHKSYLKAHGETFRIRSFLSKPKQRWGTEVGNYSYEDWLKLLQQHDNKCYYCGVELRNEEGKLMATRDHIVPLSRGGTDEISNIVPACKSCNGSKSNKLISEWKV